MSENTESTSTSEREVTTVETERILETVDESSDNIAQGYLMEMACTAESSETLSVNRSLSPRTSQQLIDSKRAALLMLDSLTSNSVPSVIPESDCYSGHLNKSNQEQTSLCPSYLSVDLTEPESEDIVTIISESSSENSRSSVKDSENIAEITVDLTIESDSNNSVAKITQEISENAAVLVQDSGEPPVKRPRLQMESVENSDISEDNQLILLDSNDVVDETSSSKTETDLVPHVQRESVFDFKGPPRHLTGAWEVFKTPDQRNYLRGCKWAPDGTCILTNSNDNKLRIFNLPDELYYDGGENKVLQEMEPAVQVKEADTIYDFSWYPLMSSSQPETACLAVTSKDTPIHLYDAFTGELRCSYRAYNHVDEVVAAHCVEFNRDGSHLYCGFNKMVRVFDVTRPGREFENRPTFAKEGQRGIISCIEFSPTEAGLYAAGSYSRSIALYEEPAGSMVCMFEGQQGGVTQIKFSPDGTKLYSGGRKDNEILCWDLRNPGQILFSLLRTVITNQRIYFDITSDSRYLVSGSHDGSVLVWDTTSPPVQHSVHQDPVIKPVLGFEAHDDCVNGVSLHPTLPVIASASGQRHFQAVDSEEESQDSAGQRTIDNSLRLWWI